MESLTPFEFFKKEVSHEDVVVRTEAMLKMLLIASLMDPGDVREQLVPLLASKLQVEEPEHDQVLLAMAKHLGGVLPFMGERSTQLQPLLEASGEGRDVCATMLHVVLVLFAGRKQRIWYSWTNMRTVSSSRPNRGGRGCLLSQGKCCLVDASFASSL